MTVMLTLVRLRWALTMAAMRKSPWQVVGYVVGLLFALLGIVGLTVAAVAVGEGPAWLEPLNVGTDAYLSMTRSLVLVVAAYVTVFVVAVQLMMIGESSTMSPRKFSLYGIPDRTLSGGLLMASLSGLPAIAGTVALMLWAVAYRWLGAVPVVVAILAAPLAIITIMSLCRLVIALSTTLVRSDKGRGLFYLVVMVLFVFMAQVPNLMMNGGAENGRVSPELFSDLNVALGNASAVLAWTPFAAAFQLPFDALAGAWLPFLGRLAVLAFTWAVCFMGATWCLRHDRLTVGQDTSSAVGKGVGAFGWVPDSPSGAISARMLTYLKRDPRQSLMVVFPVMFVVLFALQSHGDSVVIWQSLTWMSLFMCIVESNGLAYDGGGFTMQVLAGVRGLDNRFGRVRVLAGISTVYLVALAIGIFLFTGDWRTLDGLGIGLMCTMIGIGAIWAALGLAEVVSCLLMYPVPSIDKPFSSPQGRAAAQFLVLVQIFGSVAVMLPTGIVALIVGFTLGLEAVVWSVGPVALVNGAVLLLLGSWIGGKLLDARAVEIVRTLDSFASLQK